MQKIPGKTNKERQTSFVNNRRREVFHFKLECIFLFIIEIKGNVTVRT